MFDLLSIMWCLTVAKGSCYGTSLHLLVKIIAEKDTAVPILVQDNCTHM